MGTPLFSVPVLQGLIDNYNVVGVVTQPDKEVGRHKELEASPIKKLALKYNIPVVQPVKVRNEYQCVLDFNPDIIVTCAYGQIIPIEILDFPKYKCVYEEKGILNIYNLYEKDEIIDGNFIYNLTIPGWITFEFSKQCIFSLNQIYNFNEIISENLDYQRMRPTLNPTQKIRKIDYEHGNGINDNLDSIIFEFIFFNYEKINETLQFDFSKCDIEINNIDSIIVYDQNGNEVDNFEFIR